MPMASNCAIGIFDSGIGGLSVLRHIRSQLPLEDLLYFADSAHAPYGAKPESVVVARSLAIADFLLRRGAGSLVVACNTATAAAISALRIAYPDVPVIGVEPGLKPASALTQSMIVGVLATEGTLSSTKFLALRERITAATGVKFVLQPCTGLAMQVEQGESRSPATAVLLRGFLAPLLQQGADTLVLGCTHYPFVQPLIEVIIDTLTSRPIAIVDTGEAVARQLQRLLHVDMHAVPSGHGTLQAFTTGTAASLSSAFATLLNLVPEVTYVDTAADF